MRILGSVILSLQSCLFACADQPTPASPGGGAAEPFEFMWQIELPGSKRQALLFYSRHDGGIYIAQAGADQVAPKSALWRGWWPLHLYAPRWLDESNLAFRGTFITGAGPTGNRAFDATLRFSYDGNHWQTLEPELSEPPFEKPIRLHCGSMEGVEIRNETALDMLPSYPADVSVDYQTQRLVLLHDPAINRLEPHVMASDSGYHLTWIGEAPLRTAAIARQGTIWVVLPADGRPLHIASAANMEDCANCRAGVSLQPLSRWIFTPMNRAQEPASRLNPAVQAPCQPVGPTGSA